MNHQNAFIQCLHAVLVCVTLLGLSDAACNELTQYECQSGRCIPLYWRCDLRQNCENNEDEEGCDSVTCTSPQYPFQCSSGKCIPKSWVCDLSLRQDCPDGEDQMNCGNIDCTADYLWQCADTVCIQKDRRCDGTIHCPDGSDEIGCDETQCKKDEFKCNSGQCIPLDYVCDQNVDCPGSDQEDEENCPGDRPCDEFSFRCDNGVCIIGYLKCDGFPNCKKGEDEICGPLCHQCDGWYGLDYQCYPDDYKYAEEAACDEGETCSSSIKKNGRGILQYSVGCRRKNYCATLESNNPEECYTNPGSIDNLEKCTYCCDGQFCNAIKAFPGHPIEITTEAPGLQCAVCDGWRNARWGCGSNIETCKKWEQCSTTYKLNAKGILVYTIGCKSNAYCKKSHTEATDCDLGQQDKCIFCCKEDNCNAYNENPQVTTSQTR
ncbi:very low-density lipoprotein receptor-like [Ptychodera flava]|uniref:very low-density lipoprotein receptor-like n=1 Tax=Ptychodera flava TaxID=63121 RepID=UPI003969E8D2